MSQRQKKINELGSIVAILVAMILVVLALIYAEMFYFTYDLDNSVTGTNLNTTAKIEKEFDQIKQTLSVDELYNSLERIGNWPIDLDKVAMQKTNPFVPESIVAEENEDLSVEVSDVENIELNSDLPVEEVKLKSELLE